MIDSLPLKENTCIEDHREKSKACRYRFILVEEIHSKFKQQRNQTIMQILLNWNKQQQILEFLSEQNPFLSN